MSRSIYPTYPSVLGEEQKDYLLATLKDWSIAHGLSVRPADAFVSQEQDPGGVLATVAPVTLFPSLFPKSCFHEALSIQTAYNELYSSLARSEAWLEEVVKELVEIDDFISQLWKVHLAVKKLPGGYAQDLSLGLFRSDYMVHMNPEGSAKRLQIKQVEFNTIASSFGGLSRKVAELHRYLLSVDAYPSSAEGNAHEKLLLPEALPDNKSIPGLAAGLADAHEAYISQENPDETESVPKDRKCVLFVVQDPERNVFDQRHLEYALLANHGVRSFRVPFDKILDQTKVSPDRNLYYVPPHSPSQPWEVTTVYLRAGYSPGDYKSEDAWTARLQLERSRAIQCPSVLTQLAGCKKVQQVLATPGSKHVERFIKDEETVALLKQTFAPIYPMDDSDAGREAKKLATDPETASRYVLKPQREGGGNNVYRKKISAFLDSMPESHWPAWILMEMIEPPALKNIILRNGKVEEGGVIGELGVYGTCLWNRNKAVDCGAEINREAGYLLRTKGDASEEGGVAAGFGAVDSCCLIDL